MRSILINTLLLSCVVSASAAQNTTGPLVFQLPASTRALGLGGSYPNAAPDPDAIFYNPALLQGAAGFSLGSQFYGSNGRAFSITGASGGFGVGVQVLDYDLSFFAQPDDIGSPAALSINGMRPTGEAALAVGYTRTFFGKVRLGGAAKWAGHWGDDMRATAYALDLGTTINPLNWLTVALSVQNLGPSFEFGQSQYDLPTRVALYVAQRSRPVGQLDVSVMAGALGGPDYDARGSIGIEIGYWPFSGLNFYARAGGLIGTSEYRPPIVSGTVEQAPFNAGAGVSWGRLSLDYALEPFRRADDAHRIGLRVR